MNYIQLYQAIQDYAENTESLFVANIPVFVQQAEERIFNTINFPSLRKNVTGTLTQGNQYLSLPNDWLSTYSIAIYTSDYTVPYTYLLNKDVNFIREAYPAPTVANQGVPKYYALFGPNYSSPNELSCILGPTPDSDYNVELHYFFYPSSIVQGIITGFGTITTGSNYVPGNYVEVPLIYNSTNIGGGTGATANITVNSSKQVSSVTLTNGGQFYNVGDVLTVSGTTIGSAGTGFSIPVSAINNSTGTSWLGDNFDPVLLYGSMREAMLFMKGEQDLVTYYETKYQEALGLAKRLGDGLERGDAYRDGQTKLNVSGSGT
jgi:hypothetical protein